jgi:hypothetical protein
MAIDALHAAQAVAALAHQVGEQEPGVHSHVFESMR